MGDGLVVRIDAPVAPVLALHAEWYLGYLLVAVDGQAGAGQTHVALVEAHDHRPAHDPTHRRGRRGIAAAARAAAAAAAVALLACRVALPLRVRRLAQLAAGGRVLRGVRRVAGLDELARVEVVVAAVDGRRKRAVLEVEEGRVGAGNAARRVPGVGGAAQAAHHAAGDRPDDVELMRALPPQDAATWLGRQLLRRAGAVEPVLEAPVVDHAQAAELAVACHLPQAEHPRLEAVLHVHAQQHAVALRRGDHRLGALDVDGHRLFDEHVLLGLKRHPCMLGVEVVGGRDVDQVHALARHQPGRVVVDLGVRVVLLEPAQYLFVDVAGRGQLEVGVLGELRDHGAGGAPEPDDAYADHGVLRCHIAHLLLLGSFIPWGPARPSVQRPRG